MKSIDLIKFAPDSLTKAIAESGGQTVAVAGYVRSADEETISICSNQLSRSYVEFPRTSVVAAFRTDDESTKITLLVAREAEMRIVRYARAGSGTQAGECGCPDIGVQEARPLDSIHPALARLAAEMRAIKEFLKNSSGRLQCDLARHASVIAGKDPKKIDIEYRNCLQGFSPEDSNLPFGRPL